METLCTIAGAALVISACIAAVSWCLLRFIDARRCCLVDEMMNRMMVECSEVSTWCHQDEKVCETAKYLMESARVIRERRAVCGQVSHEGISHFRERMRAIPAQSP